MRVKVAIHAPDGGKKFARMNRSRKEWSMAKKRAAARRHAPKEFKSAFVSMDSAELGWHGARGGRTTRIEFRDGRGQKVGELVISAARVRWWGARDKTPIVVSARSLDDLFWMWHQRQG